MARGLKLSKELSVRELRLKTPPAGTAPASARLHAICKHPLKQSRAEAARRRRGPSALRSSRAPHFRRTGEPLLQRPLARRWHSLHRASPLTRLFIDRRQTDIIANPRAGFLRCIRMSEDVALPFCTAPDGCYNSPVIFMPRGLGRRRDPRFSEARRARRLNSVVSLLITRYAS
jgi:hypothetical protein